MVNNGTTAGQHDTPQRTATYERPFTCKGNYLVIVCVSASCHMVDAIDFECSMYVHIHPPNMFLNVKCDRHS